MKKSRTWCGTLRFVPKKETLRPITKLRRTLAPQRAREQQIINGRISLRKADYSRFRMRTVQTALTNPKHVLRDRSRTSHRFMLGAAVDNFDEVYAKYRPFVMNFRKSIQDRASKKGPYIFAGDVSKAFDRVRPERALALAKKVIGDHPYHLRTVVMQFPTAMPGGKLRVLEQTTCSSQEELASMPDIGSFAIALRSTKKAAYGREGVLVVDRGRDRAQHISADIIKRNLERHLEGGVVFSRGKWFKKKRGIMQGSKLSGLLLSLIMGDIENEHFKDIVHENFCNDEPGGGVMSQFAKFAVSKRLRPIMMMRMVDDILVLGESKSMVSSIANKFLQGFKEDGVHMAPDKTKSNFALRESKTREKICQRGNALHSNRWIPWCGLMIDARTLEVQADYVRYHGKDINKSINVAERGRTGLRQLAQRVCNYLRPKCIPILFDSIINSAVTCRVNIYQLFAVAAIKMHLLLSALPNARSRPKLIRDAVNKAIVFLPKLMRRRAAAVQRRTEQPCRLNVSSAHITYLGLHAFYTILKHKHALYRPVLKDLRKDLYSPSNMDAAKHLQAAVDPARHTSMLASIGF